MTMPFDILGSGSLKQDGPLSIVAMEKQEQARLVHDHRLGKREGHADAGEPSADGACCSSARHGQFLRFLFPRQGVAPQE
jgi:hypothetical protein